ncbi:hypothetical protein WA026_013119 [Henosepilachna vigintioctopunctata]|uniref:Uncharacterized protein n=1 Tax=Henosepilachna vigintioctopunctata TaxID=420089 RepID=A0AAW1UL55_9CUCU
MELLKLKANRIQRAENFNVTDRYGHDFIAYASAGKYLAKTNDSTSSTVHLTLLSRVLEKQAICHSLTVPFLPSSRRRLKHVCGIRELME